MGIFRGWNAMKVHSEAPVREDQSKPDVPRFVSRRRGPRRTRSLPAMLLVHVALLLLTTSPAAAQSYQFIHYPAAAGLPQQRVLSIYRIGRATFGSGPKAA